MVSDGRARMTDSDVLQLALTQEPHPDNLAAALHGGFTIAWLEAAGFADAVRMDPHAEVRPVVLVPPASLATAQARALLPDTVAFSDASANVSRSALLVHAMTHDPRRLMSATEDRLHQQCRASVYPDSVTMVARLRDAGVPAVISGAGPSVLAFAPAGDLSVMAELAGQDWIVKAVPVAPVGAREVPMPPLS
jgi:homoserine kinase